MPIRYSLQRRHHASQTKRAPMPVAGVATERLAPDELERLLAEGANMNEDEACQMALED
jgi:hypothetical protein